MVGHARIHPVPSFHRGSRHCHITRVIYLHEVFIHLRRVNGITESYGNTTGGYLLYDIRG